MSLARIKLDKVTLDFPILDATRSFRKSLLGGGIGGLISQRNGGSRHVTVRALDAITMDINDGDRLGLIGANGAGKSTLLRVLAGIYPPTSGQCTVEGRVSSLLGIGLGMDVDDTGLENIRSIGLFLGMSPREIREKTEEIASFSELGDYLGLPVRIYSSGMMLRLSFAIATAIDPDILLLDEGLGAGDASFAEKAKRRVDDLVARSSVLVLASHSDALIREMCNRAALLSHGRVEAIGDVDEVLGTYHCQTGTHELGRG